MKTSSKNLLMLVAAIIVLLVGYRLVFPSPLPDDQQIKAELADAVIAAQIKDVAGLTRPLSTLFQDGNGYTADQLRYMLGRNIQNFDTINVSMSSITVTVKGDTAYTEEYVTIDASGNGGVSFRYHGPLNLDWKKEPSTRLLVIPTQVWRVVKTDVGFGSMD